MKATARFPDVEGRNQDAWPPGIFSWFRHSRISSCIVFFLLLLPPPLISRRTALPCSIEFSGESPDRPAGDDECACLPRGLGLSPACSFASHSRETRPALSALAVTSQTGRRKAALGNERVVRAEITAAWRPSRARTEETCDPDASLSLMHRCPSPHCIGET